MSFTVPNWAQTQIAIAAGLDPSGLSVRHEDDRFIVFLQYTPHGEVKVSKISGEITYL